MRPALHVVLQYLSSSRTEAQQPLTPADELLSHVTFRIASTLASRRVRDFAYLTRLMEQRVEELERWLRAHPQAVIHPDVHFRYDEQNGVHWRAGSAIKARQRLLTIPHSLSLSYLNALVDEAYPVFRSSRSDFTVEAIGFFYLMLQYINRDTSFWQPYLGTLPAPGTLTTPLCFDDDDNAWLAGTDVAATMSQRKQLYEQYYHKGMSRISASGVDVSQFSWSVMQAVVSKQFH